MLENQQHQVYEICFLDKIELEGRHFIITFRVIDLFSVNKQVIFIMIVMQTQENIYLCFSKINTRLWFC